MNVHNDQPPFEVFYDADCPLCRREIEMVRRKDKFKLLILTDISSPTFEPAETGKTIKTLMKEIHGRKVDGTWVTGVEVFRQIYDRLGFGSAVALSRWPVVRELMTVGYKFFAKIRYLTAIRRINRESKSQATCEQECSPFKRDEEGSFE